MSRFHHLHCFVALAAFALAPSISSAQFNQAPLISTSLGGIVSATYGYFTYISATNGLSSGSSDRITSTTTSIVAQTSGAISITTNNVNTGYFNSNGVLTVPGISATANLTSVTSLYASGDITLGTRLKFINPNGNGGGSAVIGFMGDGTRRLDVYDYGSGGTLMSLTDSLSGGKLGIGTVAPNAKLDVSGAVSATQLLVPGAWCGVRKATVNSSNGTVTYSSPQVSCNGSVITVTAAYDASSESYRAGTVTCPSGYSSGWSTAWSGSYILFCVKN